MKERAIDRNLNWPRNFWLLTNGHSVGSILIPLLGTTSDGEGYGYLS